MKRIIVIAAFFLFGVSLFAENASVIGFDLGLTSGYPSYGKTTNDSVSSITNTNGYKRIIVGFSGDIFYKPVEPVHIFAGADILTDFLWNDGFYSYHFGYAFLLGMKVYPFSKGFAVSCAYALGSRSDFYNTTDGDSVKSNAKWGNGFRIGLEYDFSKLLNKKYIPAVGFYYRFMPCGDNMYDNIFAGYISLEL
jgi:hypothetical protein